jgi:hypothetical protein
MKPAAALLAILATAGAAHAQGEEDVFGFDPEPGADDATSAADCADGTAFACAFATDPLAAPSSPFALTSILTPARWRDLAVSDADHDAIVGFALGAARDDSGVFFAGATGHENRWLIEGAPGEALRTGGVDTGVPLAFVESVTVTAGGFGARDRASTGGAVDVRLIRGGDRHEVTAEVWASAATSRSPVPPRIAYEPVTATALDPRTLSVALTARGPITRLAGARLWYAAGARPILRRDGITRSTQRLNDLDGDGFPNVDADGNFVLDPIDRRTFDDLAYEVPLLARVGAERGAHRLELTALATPFRDSRFLAVATESASGVRATGFTFDGIATWRGTWARTRARVTASWHRSSYDEDPVLGDAATPQRQVGAIPLPADLPEDAALAAACDDTAATDPHPTIENCPLTTLFATGGAGLLAGQTSDLPALTAEVLHQRGRHTLSLGVAGEDGRLVERRRFTGGVLRRDLGGFLDDLRFVEPTDDAAAPLCDPDDPELDPTGDHTTRCRVVDRASRTYRTRHLAAFAADEWRPRADVAFTGGVRWETTELGDAFDLGDQVSPRVGLAWDFLGKGRSRLFAGFGRTYLVVPAGLGQHAVRDFATVDTTDLGGFTQAYFDDGVNTAIDPGLQAMFTEELVVGVQGVIRDALRFTAWGQARWLRRGLDDVGQADGTGYLLTNPDAATRRSLLVAAELATDPTARLGVRLQYQHARSRGTTAGGAYDPSIPGALYTSPMFDIGATAANLDGALAADLPHRAAIELVARGRLGPIPVVAGLRTTVSSGRPTNLTAGQSNALILPRGAGGRLGLVTSTSLHLAADLGRGIELVADITNLFDRQRATSISEVYTTDDVLPIVGGDASDLPFLVVEDATLGPAFTARRHSTYGQPTARQAPLAAAIGVRAAF